jgi:hypothetical protein
MNDSKYMGLDVHQATISVAVLDSAGKLVMKRSWNESRDGRRRSSCLTSD